MRGEVLSHMPFKYKGPPGEESICSPGEKATALHLILALQKRGPSVLYVPTENLANNGEKHYGFVCMSCELYNLLLTEEDC